MGLHHPALANQLNNRGEILNALGNPQEARSSFERAIVIWERELGPADPILATALAGIGISYLAEHKPLDALGSLERVYKLQHGEDVDPVDEAETSFALAQALWDSGRDANRARQLAQEAKNAYSRAAMSKEV